MWYKCCLRLLHHAPPTIMHCTFKLRNETKSFPYLAALIGYLVTAMGKVTTIDTVVMSFPMSTEHNADSLRRESQG